MTGRFLYRDDSRVGAVIAAGFAAAAVSSAYLPLWLSDHGLSAAEIGRVLGLAALLRVVGGPLGGWVADALGRADAMIIGAAGVAALSSALLPSLHGFVPLLLAVAVLGMGSALLSPLTDALAWALAAAGRLAYGPTRAWGSVAYMGATAAAGLALERMGSGAVPVLLASGYALAAVLAFRLPKTGRVAPPGRMATTGRIATTGRLPRMRAGTLPWRVLAEPGFGLALVATGLIQGSHAAYYSFAPLHWRAAGIGDGLIGLLIAEGVIAEVALFLWGRALIARLGPARLTAVAAVTCLVRWTALAFVAEPWALAGLQVLHAGTFACQHLSTMLVLGTLAPGRAAMAQTLVSALGFSAATAALVWVSGQLYGSWGGLVFLPMAFVGGAAVATVPGLAAVWRRHLASSAG